MQRPLDEATELLTRSAICNGMAPESIAALAKHASLLDRARGDQLSEEGARAATLFLVARGVVKLVRALDTGREVIIELLGRGDLFGEAALTDGAQYDTRAICVHPSTLLAIPRDHALAFVQSNPDAVRNVLSLLHVGLLRAHKRVEDLSVFGVRQRIARLLLRLADWTGRTEHESLVVPVALSRQELAALVGTTMETTIRVISGLRHQGLIRPNRCGFVLPDRAGLELIAEGA